MNESMIEAISFICLFGIAMVVVVRGFLSRMGETGESIKEGIAREIKIKKQLRRIGELEEKLEKARTVSMSRTAVVISQEKGKIIREQAEELDNIRMSMEKIKGWATNLQELERDFEKLQTLALWMTGCGYDFTQHPYYMDNKYLLTGEGKEPVKPFTPQEAHEEMLRHVPCPVCGASTIIGMHKTGDANTWKIVEGRYCPVCNWKDIPIEREKREGGYYLPTEATDHISELIKADALKKRDEVLKDDPKPKGPENTEHP